MEKDDQSGAALIGLITATPLPAPMHAMPLSAAVIALLALATVSVQAQDTGADTLYVSTVTEGQGGYFLLEGSDTRNPTLEIPAETEVTIVLNGTDTGVHNIQIEGLDPSEYVTSAGESIEYTFTAPEAGTYEYWCVPHRYVGMAGTVEVGGAGDGGGDPGNGSGGAGGGNDDGDDGESPAPGVLVAVAALALVADRLRRRRSD